MAVMLTLSKLSLTPPDYPSSVVAYLSEVIHVWLLNYYTCTLYNYRLTVITDIFTDLHTPHTCIMSSLILRLHPACWKWEWECKYHINRLNSIAINEKLATSLVAQQYYIKGKGSL